MTIISFLLFTALASGLTWFFTRKDEAQSSDGFFLGGRSLTFPIIAGSLLLTNLSTEQMVGLNGSAYAHGLSVMAWEVVAVIALVLMALFFLPRFLRTGITTVPQFLEKRFDSTAQSIANTIFYQCHFEIGLCITKEGGMAVSAVLRLVHLLAPYPSEPWYPPPYTGGTPVRLSKSPKGIDFWY
jgi:SSS family solute:Na+ symporter